MTVTGKLNAKTDLSLDEIQKAIRSFAFPSVDLVVGIGSGGTFPARLIADHLGLPVRFIHINFRDTDNSPRASEPRLLKADHISKRYQTILLVDDVSVSGKTLDRARAELKDHTVHTFVLKGRADYVLYPQIKTCVNWPWKLNSP